MVNYNKGKIYKIECLTTGLIYVGSTTKDYLSQRLTRHKSTYKQYLKGKYPFVSSFQIFENNNYRIELLEEVNCETKDQLLMREGHYIKTLDCVNRCTAGRTVKHYYQENKEQILEYKKEYRIQFRHIRTAKYICSCGSEIQHIEKARHNRTRRHQAYLETLNN